MRMPITDLQLQGRSLNKGPACRAPESGILRQLRLCGPQAAAPDQWLNSRDAQAKPFLGDRRSSNGQFWLEHSPTPLNFPWTAGHSRISAVQSESDWLGGQVKGSSSQPPPLFSLTLYTRMRIFPTQGLNPRLSHLADRFFTTEPPELLT